MNSDPVEICRVVYRETQALYEMRSTAMGAHALGFRVLYGPPVVDAPVLFVGDQPGGESIEDAQHHAGWPDRCDYAWKPWRFAQRIRSIWDADTLAASTGLNANFFRAPSAQSWRQVPLPLRRELEHFSSARAERIVQALSPRQVVVVGIGVFDRFAVGTPDTLGGTRVLLKRGVIWGVPAVGIIHVSGAQISRGDFSRLVDHVEDARARAAAL